MSDIEVTIREMEIDGDPILAYYAGRLRESLRQVPEGLVLLPRRLTAENGAKGLLSGEFAEGFEMNCGECDSVDEEAAQHCDVCNGHGTYRVDTPVGWDTIKDIYRMIVDNLAVEASPAPPTSGDDLELHRQAEDRRARIAALNKTASELRGDCCSMTGTYACKCNRYKEPTPAQAGAGDREEAPPHNLPEWDECSIRCANSDCVAKRKADGGYGEEPDGMYANELHRFINEYDDADRYRSAWFMHRLEKLLDWHANEIRAQAGAELPAKYDELIYAVASKFPGETRHETALRYIREREQPNNGGAASAKASD